MLALEVLETSYREFKIIMINMLRVLTEKLDILKEQMSNVSRGTNTRKESKLSARNQKHYCRNSVSSKDWTEQREKIK